MLEEGHISAYRHRPLPSPPIPFPSLRSGFSILPCIYTAMRKINIVALWLNQSGSVSALCQERASNPLAMSTGSSDIVRSCIHTFSLEKAEEMLGVSAEALHGTNAKNTVSVDINAEEIFGMKLRIQVLEAIGQEDALKHGILSRNKTTGTIMGLEASRKLDRNTKQPVSANGRPVFRKTRLVPFEGYEDVRPEYTVTAPVVPVPQPEHTEEDAPELF